MIDTISIYFDKFEVEPNHKLIIKNYNEDRERYFFTLTDGNEIHANSVTYISFLNEIRIRFAPFNYLYVNFEVSKVIFGNNIQPANHENFQNSIETVYNLLNDIGIHVSLKDYKIARIDLYKDINIKYSLKIIKQVFLNYHHRQRKSKFIEYSGNDNFEFINNNFTLAIYDKTKQLNECKKNIIPISPGKTLIRFEIRFRKHRKVVQALNESGIQNETDILLDENSYNNLKNVFFNYFKKNLFDCAPNISILNGNLKNAAIHAKKLGIKLPKFFELLGVQKTEKQGLYSEINAIFTKDNKTGEQQAKQKEKKDLKDIKKYGFIPKTKLTLIVDLWNMLFESHKSVLTVCKINKSIWQILEIPKLTPQQMMNNEIYLKASNE